REKSGNPLGYLRAPLALDDRRDLGSQPAGTAARSCCDNPLLNCCKRSTEFVVKRLFVNLLGRSSRTGWKPTAPGGRPRPEALEHRLMPATIAVTTLADVVNPVDGKVSLREAINIANATTALDTIVLAKGVYEIELSGAGENANATGDFDITH